MRLHSTVSVSTQDEDGCSPAAGSSCHGSSGIKLGTLSHNPWPWPSNNKRAPTRKYSSSAKSRVHLGRQQTLLTIHLRCSCAACSVVSKPEAYANQNHQQKSISKSLQRTMPKSEKGRASKRLISSTKCLRKDNARMSYDLAGFRTEQRHTPELH